MDEEIAGGRISFVTQRAPIDERGRAMYAVSRSILRALVDQLSVRDLTVLNTDKADVTLSQLSMMARLQRDKGMRGDGFEWAVHEALQGGEESVIEPVAEAMKRMSRKSFSSTSHPQSLLFGYERAKYLGFLDAVVENAPPEAVLLPDSQGRPPAFDSWVKLAAQGERAEERLGPRFRKVWKADLFVSDEARHRHVAVTIKSNHRLLEGGRGLRMGIVPSHRDLRPGVSYERIAGTSIGLWVVSLAEPNGFMDLYNDAYASVAEAICTLGRHERGNYWNKPTPMGAEIQEQLEKYPDAPVQEIEAALDEAAQQDLVDVDETLISVDAPPWLHLGQPSTASIVAPRPSFRKLD